MAHRDQAPRSNLGFSPHRPWGLPTTTSAGQQGPAAGASHLELTQGRLRKKKATSSAHQVDGRTYTFALQSGFTRLPRFTSNLDCQSETKAYSSDQFRSCRGERPLWLQDWIRASGAKHGHSFCTALIHRSIFGPGEARGLFMSVTPVAAVPCCSCLLPQPFQTNARSCLLPHLSPPHTSAAQPASAPREPHPHPLRGGSARPCSS